MIDLETPPNPIRLSVNVEQITEILSLFLEQLDIAREVSRDVLSGKVDNTPLAYMQTLYQRLGDASYLKAHYKDIQINSLYILFPLEPETVIAYANNHELTQLGGPQDGIKIPKPYVLLIQKDALGKVSITRTQPGNKQEQYTQHAIKAVTPPFSNTPNWS